MSVIEIPTGTLIEVAGGLPGPRGAQGVKGDTGLGLQGLPGPAGASGVVDVTGVAFASITAFQAVGLSGPGQFAPATATTTWLGKVRGIATGSATTGAPVVVKTAGPVTNPAWNWTGKRVFLAADGTLTTTPPATGIVQEVGQVVTATTIVVGIQIPRLRPDIPGGAAFTGSVRKAQFFKALKADGYDLDAIPISASRNDDAAISAQDGRVTQGNPFALLVQSTFGLSATDMANIFTAAAAITSV